MNKEDLRNYIKEKRKNLEYNNEVLIENLVRTKVYQKAKNIMIFYPKKYEVNLLKLLEDKNKQFYLPKIYRNELLCCPYSLNDELCISCFNTKEPVTEQKDKSLIDLVIVPALCCDINNFRLGYGGGFYDRFLSNFAGIKIVCIPKQLIVESVFPEPHDVPVDIVITD